MKIKFNENNNSEITQTKKASPEKVRYNGTDYTYVGKSKENPAVITRVKSLCECVIMTLAGCFVVPCFFKGFRKTFKNAFSELLSGQEIVKHYAINPDVFEESKEHIRIPTQAESFQKGLEDSKNVNLD